MNGGSGEIVDSIAEKFSSGPVSPSQPRSLPACLFVDLIAIYQVANPITDEALSYEKRIIESTHLFHKMSEFYSSSW